MLCLFKPSENPKFIFIPCIGLVFFNYFNERVLFMLFQVFHAGLMNKYLIFNKNKCKHRVFDVIAFVNTIVINSYNWGGVAPCVINVLYKCSA